MQRIEDVSPSLLPVACREFVVPITETKMKWKMKVKMCARARVADKNNEIQIQWPDWVWFM